MYAIIGESYVTADKLAFADCGRDYGNYACMCPRQHAYVICIVTEAIGDPKKVPGWLQQRHCPGDDDGLSAQNGNGFTSYQQFLLNAATGTPAACTTALRNFFTAQNTPDG